MDFILNTKLEIIYSTIVLVSIYIKIIIFISLITIIFKRYLRTKNKLFVKFVVSFTSTGLTLRNQNTGEAFNFDVGVINTLKIKVFGKGGTTSPTVIKEIQAS